MSNNITEDMMLNYICGEYEDEIDPDWNVSNDVFVSPQKNGDMILYCYHYMRINRIGTGRYDSHPMDNIPVFCKATVGEDISVCEITEEEYKEAIYQEYKRENVLLVGKGYRERKIPKRLEAIEKVKAYKENRNVKVK